MSSTRSSFTAVHTLSDVYLSNSDSNNSTLDLEKKPSSLKPHLLTFYNDSDELTTAPKTRCDTIVSHLRSFKVKVCGLIILCTNFLISIFRLQHREFLAEFIGTMILILLTCGISAEETLSISTHKSWLTSSFGSGNN